MVTKNIIYSALFATFLSSCGVFCDELPFDKKALTYKNKFIFDNQFRMDGIYLMERNYGGYAMRYFFQNGSYYAEGTSNEIGLECYQIKAKARELPYAWGCYIIEDNILKVQTYDPTSLNYATKYKLYERWAEIVNDTTIHFFKEIDSGGKERGLDETFHFRYCENKPDSTNILMRD